MKLLYFSLITIQFLMSMSSVHSQQKKSDKYQLALTYEQQGDFRNAARLYQELYADFPEQFTYFQGVARSLSALQRYPELMPLIEIELGKRQEIDLLCLASITAKKSSQHQKSQQYFDIALNSVDRLTNDAEIDNVIRLIAQSQSDIGSFTNAISAYIKGRGMVKGFKQAYADELSMLYVQIGNVELGIKEITNLFKQQQQYGIIQGRIAALLIKPEAESIINAELYSLAKQDFAFAKVYVWFLRETKKFDEAFIQALKIDNGLGLQGREMLEFADITLKDGQLDIAMKAYGNILDRGKNNSHFSAALYGYAKVMDQRLQANSENGAITSKEIREIINRYNDILAQQPNGQFASECMYRIGVLELYFMKDSDRAKEVFMNITNMYKQYPISAAASNQLIDIALTENDIDIAIVLANNTIQTYQFINPDEADKARFHLAQIALYKGDIDSAKSLLVVLAGKTESDISNDALELSLFLEQNKQFQAGLILWGKAMLALKQYRIEDAVTIYREIIGITKGTELAEQSQLRLCETLKDQKNPKTLEEAQIFLKEYPESIQTDAILFLIASIYIEQKQNAQAINILTDILVRFPTSRFVRKSRELIRSLRGDS